jgi:hypothetical protein
MDEQTHGQMKPRGDLYLKLERDRSCSWAVNLLSKLHPPASVFADT